MIQRYNEKLPVCSYCLEPGHTAFKCGKKPSKTLNTYNGLKISSSFGGPRKPMKKIGKVTKQWMETRKTWVDNNTDLQHICHYCGKPLPSNELTLDHKEARSRRPDLRNVQANLVPACYTCNALKGSLSHDEYRHTCYDIL